MMTTGTLSGIRCMPWENWPSNPLGVFATISYEFAENVFMCLVSSDFRNENVILDKNNILSDFWQVRDNSYPFSFEI